MTIAYGDPKGGWIPSDQELIDGLEQLRHAAVMDEEVQVKLARLEKEIETLKIFMQDGGHSHMLMRNLLDMMVRRNLQVLIVDQTVATIVPSKGRIQINEGLYALNTKDSK